MLVLGVPGQQSVPLQHLELFSAERRPPPSWRRRRRRRRRRRAFELRDDGLSEARALPLAEVLAPELPLAQHAEQVAGQQLGRRARGRGRGRGREVHGLVRLITYEASTDAPIGPKETRVLE